jgi:hypothetical protein
MKLENAHPCLLNPLLSRSKSWTTIFPSVPNAPPLQLGPVWFANWDLFLLISLELGNEVLSHLRPRKFHQEFPRRSGKQILCLLFVGWADDWGSRLDGRWDRRLLADQSKCFGRAGFWVESWDDWETMTVEKVWRLNARLLKKAFCVCVLAWVGYKWILYGLVGS